MKLYAMVGVLVAVGMNARALPAAAQIAPGEDVLAKELAATTQPALPDAPMPAWRMDKHAASAATGDVPLQLQPHPSPTIRNLPRHAAFDATHIIVAPIYLRKRDLKWLLPLTGAAIAGFETDQHTMTQVVSRNPSFNQANITFSDVLRDTFIALPPLMWVGGAAEGKDHVRETGLLGSEALADAYVLDEIVKVTTFRERPLVDNGRGEFYVGSAGLNSSFASGHSMVSWSVAAVLAGEYPSKWAQAGFYSAATAVSLARVLGQQHFPTDVLVGGAGGWLVGHYVFRAHHHWPGTNVGARLLRHNTAFRDWPKS